MRVGGLVTPNKNYVGFPEMVGKVGKLINRGKHPFEYFDVKFPGDKEIYEFHAGELKWARRKR